MNPRHSAAPDNAPLQHREWLSALADGQPDAVSEGCARWAQDENARRAWHEYQLIGDVLRSDDFAVPAGHDLAFLAKFRGRLTLEPAIVAPLPVAVRPAATSARRWAVAAAAAGFFLVGGAVVSLQGIEDEQRQMANAASQARALGRQAGESAPQAARVTAAPALASVSGSAASSALGDPQWRVVDGQMIRDARLDAYLRAHRGVAATRPGAGVGRFETVGLER